MPSDELVTDFRNRRESRDVVVAPCEPSSRRSISQRAIDGFRGKKSFAVRLDENHRAPKFFSRNFRESVCNLLVRYVIDLIGGDFAPTLDPQPAEITLAVPDQERPGWGISDAEVRPVRHQCQRSTPNAQRPILNFAFDVERSVFSLSTNAAHTGA